MVSSASSTPDRDGRFAPAPAAPARAPAAAVHALDQELAALGWSVPAGRTLELPGRGTTFVREAAGPRPDAPTLLLLHGLAATGGLNWFSAFSALARQFRVVAVDHRGHGRGIRSSSRFRLADCADDAVAVADELGIDSFTPVGYSMGGPIAQLVWHRHRERVEGMVLCATSRNFRGTPRERVQFLGLGMLLTGRRWSIDPGPLRRLVEGILVPEMRSPDMRRWIMGELKRHDTRTVMEAAESLGRFSSHEWVQDVDVPVSVVVPAQDGLVPVRRQVKLARSIPSAVLFPCEGDHLVCAQAPERFVPSLLDACLLVSRRARRDGPALAPLR